MAERFVLDNSVAMAWCFDDESDSYAREVLYSLRNAEALVPAIWPLEFGNALLVAERNRRLNKHDVATLLVNILKLPITVLQETPDRVLKEIVTLAQEHRLSTYDASYLDIAIRLGIPLATRDTALVKAAKQCHVPLYSADPG